MFDPRISIAGVEFASPVIAASGTIGFGLEYLDWIDFTQVGGISMKALTPAARQGNPPARIAETPSGVLNCVGLQNPGVPAFLRDFCKEVCALPTVIIANVAGSDEEEYEAVVLALEDTDVDMYEINVSCPNVAEGGMGIGTNPGAVFGLVSRLKQVASKPLIVKLTPNVTSIVEPAAAAVEAGADALSLINTVAGMAVDVHTRRPILSNVTGGLSGPAVKPIALRMVYEVAKAGLGVPIIGMGGIMTGEDAAEFLICGATAVMAGTATLRDPGAVVRITRELCTLAEEQGLESFDDLTGALELEV